MPKFAAVVILMQQNLNDVIWLYPDVDKGIRYVGEITSMHSLVPFSDDAVEFLNTFSGILMKNGATRAMPDVATLAFFCRKANILRLKNKYMPSGNRLGRGVAFHIAPSNVPVNFAYSLICGILSGNNNIVRVPSRNFEQVIVISEAIRQTTILLPYNSVVNRIALVKYERGSKATDIFSTLSDIRIIWGGDQSIANIRQSVIPARAFDITFADRYSICAIKAKEYLGGADAAKVAEAFYNDTYLFDQNACSAPHLVVWLGCDSAVVERAKEKFWKSLYDYAKQKYILSDVFAVDKLTAFYSQAVNMDVKRESDADNLLWRVQTGSLPENIDNYRCKAGYFTECTVAELNDIIHIVNRKYQSLAYYGFTYEELTDFVSRNKPIGIDRIVPIGKTTEFDLLWDGYNLVDMMSRSVSIL